MSTIRHLTASEYGQMDRYERLQSDRSIGPCLAFGFEEGEQIGKVL